MSTKQIIGSIQRNSESINDLIDADAVLEILADGYDWSEGPVYVPQLNGVLFSDIPPNQIHLWTEDNGASLWLSPSGYTGEMPRGGEVGSNGLILDASGSLVLCQHGDRRMAKLNSSWDDPSPDYVTLADRYEGKRFNSPNDAVYHSNGDLYFTDPPYGLEYRMDDELKEIDYQGVYRLGSDGTVTLLTKELSRPNGLAFSPDESKLYVANSDPDRAIWMVYDVDDQGELTNGQVFYDATNLVGQQAGLPDGMKVDLNGYVYATGPGGVFVFSPQAEVLGMIRTTQATSNCAFGGSNYDQLFITADRYLLRLQLKSKSK